MTPSRKRRLNQTAVVSRVPAGTTNPDARQVVVASLACSSVYALDEREKERANMGTEVRGLGVFPAYNAAVTHKEHQRFIIGSQDYRIHLALPWPETNPQFLQLFLKDENR